MAFHPSLETGFLNKNLKADVDEKLKISCKGQLDKPLKSKVGVGVDENFLIVDARL
jgi:hypothetical protein